VTQFIRSIGIAAADVATTGLPGKENAMLYLDPFSELDFRRLDAIRADHCVSIYIPTHTVSRETEQDKILLKNAIRKAIVQLAEAGADKRRVAAIEAHLQGLADDTLFWNHLADSLAVLATPDAIETYRLPRAVSVEVEVSDRFHLKPLIPLLTFPHTAYLLDIAQNQVRFWSVTEGQMQEIEVPGMPTSFSDALEQRTGDRRVGRYAPGRAQKDASTPIRPRH
jgi:hypothetical protein